MTTLRAALQLYEYEDGPHLATWHDAQATVIETGENGYRSCTFVVPMTDEQATFFYNRIVGRYLSFNSGSITLWQGRVETRGKVTGGLSVTAVGHFSVMNDDPYTAVWSVSGVERWRVVTESDQSSRKPNKYNFDKEERLNIALVKDTVYDSGNRGAYMLQTPHLGSRHVMSISFDWNFIASSDFVFRVVTLEHGFVSGSGTEELSITGNGSLQSGSRRVEFTTPNDFVLVEINAATGNTYTGESGAHYLRLTNIRVVTSVENALATNLSVAITTAGEQTATVTSTQKMYVGQELIIEQNNPTAERVIVISVDSDTEFTADFANIHGVNVGIVADIVYADEIIKDIVAKMSANYPNMVSSSTVLVQSPQIDLKQQVFEDATPGDVCRELASYGDINQNQYEVGIYDYKLLYFRPLGSGGRTWYVVTDELNIRGSIDNLVNKAYGVYQTESGEIRRTDDAVNQPSLNSNGYAVRAAVPVNSTSEAEAKAVRDALLADKSVIQPQSTIDVVYLLSPSRTRVPKAFCRAGDTLILLDAPPTLGEEIDRVTSFVVSETTYNVDNDDLKPSPGLPLPSMEQLLSQMARGIE